MIKLVIFDLDGVIIDLKNCHYESLNLALNEKSNHYVINLDEHYKFYDGLPTKEKLRMLSKYKGLPSEDYEFILQKKQSYTLQYVYEKVKPVDHILKLFNKLKENGFKLCVASNSVSNTIYCVLSQLKILHLVDKVFSNQDVKFSKPNPEIYFRAISHFGFTPQESLIVEDSPFGLEAAYQSGAHILRVKNSMELNVDNVFLEIEKQNMKKNKNYTWKEKNMNVLIPMAGAGSRFESAGYKLPKPLIDVAGKTMIQRVIENLNIDANFIFIVQKEHDKKYNLSDTLKLILPNCQIIFADGLTEGAACTALLAEKFINNDNPLLIANSDQFIEWDSQHFYYQISSQDIDASILTFKSTHPKWSFVKLNNEGFVKEVAEKNPISDIATVGIYFWRRGKDFVNYANSMISKNIRVNNEFYIAPVFNEAILNDKKISNYDIEKMWGLGTPEDLEHFLNNHENL